MDQSVKEYIAFSFSNNPNIEKIEIEDINGRVWAIIISPTTRRLVAFYDSHDVCIPFVDLILHTNSEPEFFYKEHHVYGIGDTVLLSDDIWEINGINIPNKTYEIINSQGIKKVAPFIDCQRIG